MQERADVVQDPIGGAVYRADSDGGRLAAPPVGTERVAASPVYGGCLRNRAGVPGSSSALINPRQGTGALRETDQRRRKDASAEVAALPRQFRHVPRNKAVSVRLPYLLRDASEKDP